MSTTDKESSAAGTDNRPPMLEENDFDSWKIRIQRYIREKPNRKLIWNFIKNGPTPYPTTTDTTGKGEQQTQVIRKKRDDEFIKAENIKELADIQAINILRSGLTEQQQKEILFDQYERFRANGNESIHDYFVRFHKLINDMKITKIQILAHQRNTKFLNNLPSYWSKYVTIVKNNHDISNVSYVNLYTDLKSYEQHAMKTLSKMNQSSGNTDPPTYMAQATKTSSHTSSQQYSPSQYVPPQPHYTPPPQQSPQAPGNKGKQIATGSQGKLATCYNCRGQGHIARECKEKKREKDSQWFKDKALLMEGKEKGVVLDAEAEAFLADVECTAYYDDSLAITTTTTFEVSHDDAYDSDVDEAPHAAAGFMANLTGISTGEGTSNDTNFHSMEEQLDSDVDSNIDDYDNIIPYHEYQSNTKVENVPNEVYPVLSDQISMITILDDMRLKLEGYMNTNKEQSLVNDSLKAELERYKTQVHDNEDTLVHVEVSRTKMLAKMKDPKCSIISLPINYAKLNNLYDTFAPQKELTREQAYWLLANEVSSNQSKHAQQLKEELTAVRIKNDSLRDENVLIKARFQELHKSKAGSNSSVSSEATIPVKPKAVASGLYSMTPKYVPPQKRINRETNSSLPRKETVTVVNLSNVPVNLSTGIKSIPDASKSKSKSDKKIHKNLPARSKNVKRVAKTPRNLNKKNRVYSSLNDKRDTCPLTRITKPEVVSLENSGSVRTNEPTNNVM
uniref:CCHC-type domain-containing protein n=1 Tax=Tanacetum cinerariifolium TaxID=118510 RepID=A0A699H649_TANCI|nr:hypothetical protein [Tanacetum cinerariifolium]